MHISCPPILTLNHTFHLPVLISFFCMPSFKNFPVYSAILPPNPLSWVALRWRLDLGQWTPWRYLGSCLQGHVGLGKVRYGVQHAGLGVWLGLGSHSLSLSLHIYKMSLILVPTSNIVKDLNEIMHATHNQEKKNWAIITHQAHQFSSVQFICSILSESLRPHGLQHARSPCPLSTPRVYSNSCSLSRWCHPTISSCHPILLQPSIFPSIRVFSNGSVLCIRWPKYWSFRFSISLSNKYSGLISFWMDWLDILAVQGTLKNFLQHHSSKHQFFGIQLSSQYNSRIQTWLLEKP